MGQITSFHIFMFAVWVGLMVALGAWVLIQKRLRRRGSVRQLRALLGSHELRPVRELQEGPIGLQGRAVANKPLQAPSTGEPVIGYTLKVTSMFNVDDVDPDVLLSTEELAEFEISDDTGRATVAATDFELRLRTEKRRLIIGHDDVPEGLADLLARYNHPVEAMPKNTFLNWEEGRLDDGETVFVYGHARQDLDPSGRAAGFRNLATRWVLGNLEGMPVVVADASRAEFLATVTRPLDSPEV